MSEVPQDSHLGPFFLIYFKDICECFPDTFYRLYVADSKIYDANVGDVLASQED